MVEHGSILTCETSISESWRRIKSTSIDLGHSFSTVKFRGNSVLPPPLKPNIRSPSSDEDLARGSLSDFSDYEPLDAESHNKIYRDVASSSNNYSGRQAHHEASDSDENPFADPFGDSHGVDDSSNFQENGRQKRL